MAAPPFLYEACDVPPGMTLDEYRRRHPARAPRRRDRLRALLRIGATPKHPPQHKGERACPPPSRS